MNQNLKNKTVIIRLILSVVAVAFLILGWSEVISDKIALAIAVAFIGISTVWSGIEAVIDKRIKSAVLNFAMTAILVVLTLTAIFL